ncbi:MAG: RT0821/Lpp0805 family surface protein [Gammaproteobacteria bacterium]|nr:RT0821/Lpp0805 family surface protein [Gammaproteobacteria bacterium]
MKHAKKYILAGMITVVAFSMAGCSPGNNVPGSTAAGAVGGGLLGGAIFGGSPYGIIGGALLGGIVGDQVGQAMDRQDKANMQSAVANVPVGQQAQWTDSKNNTTYSVRPVKNYTSENRYCREYQTTVTVNGKVQKAYGRACRQPDGSWKIVK